MHYAVIAVVLPFDGLIQSLMVFCRIFADQCHAQWQLFAVLPYFVKFIITVILRLEVLLVLRLLVERIEKIG